MITEELKEKDITEISELASRNLIYDKFSPELIREKCFEDPFYDSKFNIVAKDKGNIIAFLIGAFRDYDKGKFGWIKLMTVEKSYRRKKIATQMVNQLTEEVKKKGATDLKVMDIPLNYYMPGLDPRYTDGVSFLLRNRFEHIGESINMEADLFNINFNTLDMEKELEKEGFTIKRAEPKDKEPTLEFIRPIWKLWEYEVSQTFKNKPITLHIAYYKEKVVAFSAFAGNNVGLPWFGPMGTDPNMRGKKLGEILLKRCLADQKIQGHHVSIIPWAGPIAFYKNTVNADINRVFWRFNKPLTETKG